jgi:hypothetical protein
MKEGSLNSYGKSNNFCSTIKYDLRFGTSYDISRNQCLFGGSGCPSGSGSLELSEDASQLIVNLPIFNAWVNSNGTYGRRNCQVNCGIVVPDGWTYAISGVQFNMFVDIKNPAKCTQTSSSYFSGQSSQSMLQFNGFTEEKKNMDCMRPFLSVHTSGVPVASQQGQTLTALSVSLLLNQLIMPW